MYDKLAPEWPVPFILERAASASLLVAELQSESARQAVIFAELGAGRLVWFTFFRFDSPKTDLLA